MARASNRRDQRPHLRGATNRTKNLRISVCKPIPWKNHLGYFEWDDKKAALNLLKHGVEFEEAALAFFDHGFIRLRDEKHSITEVRYSGIGRTPLGRVLVTYYTERGNNIRIISSRKANKKERKTYEDRKD